MATFDRVLSDAASMLRAREGRSSLAKMSLTTHCGSAGRDLATGLGDVPLGSIRISRPEDDGDVFLHLIDKRVEPTLKRLSLSRANGEREGQYGATAGWYAIWR
jgi:hypothetical protein